MENCKEMQIKVIGLRGEEGTKEMADKSRKTKDRVKSSEKEGSQRKVCFHLYYSGRIFKKEHDVTSMSVEQRYFIKHSCTPFTIRTRLLPPYRFNFSSFFFYFLA